MEHLYSSIENQALPLHGNIGAVKSGAGEVPLRSGVFEFRSENPVHACLFDPSFCCIFPGHLRISFFSHYLLDKIFLILNTTPSMNRTVQNAGNILEMADPSRKAVLVPFRKGKGTLHLQIKTIKKSVAIFFHLFYFSEDHLNRLLRRWEFH